MNNFKKFFAEKVSKSFCKGDKVVDTNPSCKQRGSKGVVTAVKKIKGKKGNIIGNKVCYKCTNDGKSWDKGDNLEKTEIQLKKAKS